MIDHFAAISAIITQVAQLPKPNRQFLTHVLHLFMSITARINFLQLARHSSHYSEQACRNQFEKWVDFARINAEYIRQHGSGHYLVGFDPTYLRKAGKATPGVGKYWSSVAQQVCWGLELGLLSILDVYHHTAFHLDAILTPTTAERTAKGIDLTDHYAQCVIYSKELFASLLCQYLVVDAYFAKREFIDRILRQTSLAVITRLRKDANCNYLYQGPKRAGKGAPKKYAGKIDWNNPERSAFTLAYQDAHCRTYQAVVYCVFLKRNIAIAFCEDLDAKGLVVGYTIYACTDTRLTALLIQQYYRVRFQHEFLIRDGKQHMGLQDCQARSINKLEYHANTSLTGVNIAKIEHWLKPGKTNEAFSMANVKTLYHNHLLMERLFSIFPSETELLKNDPKIHQLYSFGLMAA